MAIPLGYRCWLLLFFKDCWNTSSHGRTAAHSLVALYQLTLLTSVRLLDEHRCSSSHVLSSILRRTVGLYDGEEATGILFKTESLLVSRIVIYLFFIVYSYSLFIYGYPSRLQQLCCSLRLLEHFPWPYHCSLFAVPLTVHDHKSILFVVL